jgi:hypothetical protein
MNVLDASQQLLVWFKENDTFNLSSNSKAINKKDACSLEEEAAICIALDSLEKLGVITKYKDQSIWVLGRPLNMFSQNVEINGIVALHVSNVINNFFSLSDDKENMCDSTNLTENDIMKLVEICSFMAQNFNNKKDEKEPPTKKK